MKRLPTIVAFAAFVGLILGWSYLVWGASQSSRSTIQHETATRDQSGSNKQSIQEGQKTDQALARYTWWLTAFTGILAIATIGLGVATVGLYFASERQFKLARDEFLASRRPQLRLKHMWLATADGKHFSGHIRNGEPVTVRLDIVNVGSTDAFVELINFVTIVIPPSRKLPQRPPYNEPNNQPFRVGGLRLPGGVTFTHVVHGTILSNQDMLAIRNGTPTLYCVGTIEYRDTAGQFRQTAFCRRLVFDQRPVRPIDTGRFEKYEDPDYEYQD